MNMYGKIIVIKRSGADGAHFPLTASACLFGRGQDCDIRIQMPTVDNEQCVINVNDKGHVLMRNLSTVTPTLVNEKILSDTLTVLSHGDIITIVDRKFRFEFPVDSRFYPKSPKGKSPKSPRNSSINNDSVIGLKSPGKPQQKSPKPLSPRTDNVPVSEVYSKSPLKQMITTSLNSVLTEEVNTSANYSINSSELPMPPASFYNSTPKGLKRLSDVRQNKGTPIQKMTPGTSTQIMPSTPLSSPGRKSVSGLTARTHASLQKSINYLKRRSMPLFERDEETNADELVHEESAATNKSMSQTAKRKSSSSNFDVLLSSKRKRVSFGPSLSPEHFDKTLPPKTPIKKGATPTRVNPGRKSLLKRNSPKSLKKTATPRKASPGAKVLAVTPSVENLDSTSPKQSSAKKQPGKRLSTAPSPLPQVNKAHESKDVSTPVQSSTSAEPVTPASSRKENRARSMSPTSIESAKPATPASSRKNRARSMSPTSIESVKTATPASSRKNRARSMSPTLIESAEPVTPASSRKENQARSMSPTLIKSAKPVTPTSIRQENRARSMSPILSESAEPVTPSSGRKENRSSPKATLSSPTQSYLTDSPILSQDLFSQRSPIVAESSFLSSESLSPEKKKPGVRAKSEGPVDKKSTGKRNRSLGTSPLISPLVNKSNLKVKNVRLSGKSPASAIQYEKTPIVKRAGKLSVEKTELNSSLTGIKEFIETHRASTGLPKASDLFVSPVHTTTVDPWGTSSSTRPHSLRKSLAGTPKRRSAGASFSGLSDIFKTPQNNQDVSNADSAKPFKTVDTPRPIPSGRRNSTPKDSARTPSRLRDTSFSGISHLFKTPGENSDVVDGNQPTFNSVKVVLEALDHVSGRKGRPPKKSLGSASEDISFSYISPLFRSPDPQLDNNVLESPKSVSSKKTTPRSNTPKIFSVNTSFLSPSISDLFKTPVQQNNVAEAKSTQKSVGSIQIVENTEEISGKRNRTPKKFFGDVSPVSTKKKKSESFRSPRSNTKSPLKTPKSPKSPVQAEKLSGKIQSPPQDRNKVVALRVIHGHSVTPKVAVHTKTPSVTPKVAVYTKTPAKTPKVAVHTKTPLRTPKSIKKTAAVSAKKTFRTWSDIVKTGVSKPTAVVKPSLLASKVTAIKKKAGLPLKMTAKTPKTPRAIARALAPSTGHAESPATILVGKRVAMKPKTPVRLPRKGRKQEMGKTSRISVGNTSFTGLSDMFKTPEPGQPADVSALYDQIPDTPNGPNEMFVSPLAGIEDKRRSTNLIGVRELFAQKKRQSMILAGVRELMASPKIPSTSQCDSLTPTALTRLMKTPKGPRHVSKIPRPSPNITPSGLKRMMKVPTYVSPYGVENLFIEVENETPKSSQKAKPPKTLQMYSPDANAATTGDDKIVSPKQSAAKKPRGGTKRKADVIDTQIPAKMIKATQETVEQDDGELPLEKKRTKVSSPKKTVTADPSSRTVRGRPKAEVDIVVVEPEVKPVAKGRRGKSGNVQPDILTLSDAQTNVKSSRTGRGRPKAEVIVEPEIKLAAKGRRGKSGDVQPDILTLSDAQTNVKSSRTGRGRPKAENIVEPEIKPAAKGKRGKSGDVQPDILTLCDAQTNVKSSRNGRGRPKAEVIVEPEIKPAAEGRRGKSGDVQPDILTLSDALTNVKSSRTGRGRPKAVVIVEPEIKPAAEGRRGKSGDFQPDILTLSDALTNVKLSRTGRGRPKAEVIVEPEIKPAAKGRRGKSGDVQPDILTLSDAQTNVKSSRTGRGRPKTKVIVEPEIKPAAKGRRGKSGDVQPDILTLSDAQTNVKSSRTGRGRPKAEVIVEPEIKPAAKGRRGKSNDAEPVLSVEVAEPIEAKSSRTGRSKSAVTTLVEVSVLDVTVGVAKGAKKSKGKMAETIIETGNVQVNMIKSRRGAPVAPPANVSPIKQQPVKKTAAKERKQVQPIQSESSIESPAKPTAKATNDKRKRKNPTALSNIPEERSAPVKKYRGKATNEPIAEAVSLVPVQTGRKGRSKAEPEKASIKTVGLIAEKNEPQAAVKESAAGKGGKRKQVEPVEVPSSPKAGTKRAQRNKNTADEAVPDKQSKVSSSSSKAAASSAKQTKASEKVTAAKPKKGSVETLKLEEVSRSTRGRRK